MTRPVDVEDLSLQRGSFRLGPLSFSVPAGGRFAVVGPSGSGKTTLLRCLAGLERPGSGTIRIGDSTVADARTNVPPDQRGLGLVFQDGALWPHMTALQHLVFAAPGLPRADALELLRRAGLQDHAHRKPGVLSGGEAQRLGLCRALAPGPDVLLLDEPLRSVDVHQRDALVLLLRSLADERGLTTILVTHDRDEALALATDLVVLHEGRLVEQGPAAVLLREPATAFTAAFLAGAACLPTVPAGPDRVGTPFGEFVRPPGASGDLRLVLFPGDVRVCENGAAGPTGRVLAGLPIDRGYRLRINLGDQLLQADARDLMLPGTAAVLQLSGPPRLLPWRRDVGAGAP